MMTVDAGGPGDPRSGDRVLFSLNGNIVDVTEVWQPGGAPQDVAEGVQLVEGLVVPPAPPALIHPWSDPWPHGDVREDQVRVRVAVGSDGDAFGAIFAIGDGLVRTGAELQHWVPWGDLDSEAENDPNLRDVLERHGVDMAGRLEARRERERRWRRAYDEWLAAQPLDRAIGGVGGGEIAAGFFFLAAATLPMVARLAVVLWRDLNYGGLIITHEKDGEVRIVEHPALDRQRIIHVDPDGNVEVIDASEGVYDGILALLRTALGRRN